MEPAHPVAKAERPRPGGLPAPPALLVFLLLALALGCDREDARRPASGQSPAQGPPAASPKDRVADRESALSAHIAANPNDIGAKLALGHLYYDTDRPHRAVPLYLEVLEHREDPGVRTDLGTCYKNMGFLDQARAEYKRVLSDHPEHVQATYNLAVVSLLAGDAARAAELWERVAVLAPGKPVATVALRNAAEARAEAQRTKALATDTAPEKDSHP